MAEPDPDRTLPTNGQLARIFHEIGDMLEVKGELVFKTVAYHRAADAIAHSPFDVAGAYAAGDRPKIGGVGQAISDKIAELVTTGRMAHVRAAARRRSRRPRRAPGGAPGRPATVRLLYETLQIESLEDLRQAAEAGRLRTVKGLSEKTEQQVLEGIAAAREPTGTRMLIHRASALVESLATALSALPGRPAGRAGRARSGGGRRRSAISTCWPRPPTRPGLIEAFTGLGAVDGVINKGGYKAAVQLLRGPQADLMVMPPGEAGTYLIHFTGSKEHNVKLRARARDKGWSLSEKGFVQDRRPDRAPDVPARKRTPTRSSTCRSSSPSCGRTRARSRRRSPGACPSSSPRTTSRATATPIRTGRTASTRSSRWPRPAAAAGTPTRS